MAEPLQTPRILKERVVAQIVPTKWAQILRALALQFEIECAKNGAKTAAQTLQARAQIAILSERL